MYQKNSCKKCGNGIFEIDFDNDFNNTDYKRYKVCTNCNEKKLFRTRGKNTGITKSQFRSIKRITRYFVNNWNFGRGLNEAKVNFQKETGIVYLSIRTTGNVYTLEGGHFCIGQRGKINLLSRYALCSDKKHNKSMASHFCKMLNGKLSKYFR